MPAKRSMKQIEKQQRRKVKGKEEAKEKGRFQKTIGALDIPEMTTEELMEQLGKMKAITPTGLAIHYNLKVSTAKKLLDELMEQKAITLASRSHNLKVYTLA
jgi:ribosomal protein S25